MADGILGLGSSGSTGLNQALIDQLKSSEETAYLDPITTDIENKELEIEAVDEIEAAMMELLDLVTDFDLYTSDTNIFDEMTGSTTGSSAVFDATDTSNLEAGTISVTVTQLAQKDVYQSNIITDIEEEMSSGTLSITIGEDTYDFSTEGKTYEELVSEMNNYTKLDIGLEQVSDDSYRIIVKSSDSGLANAISISQTSIDLGFEDESSHVLSAQNMLASVDGVDYDLSSNIISMDNGLSVQAVELGDSSISLERDDSLIVESVEAIATKYNEIVDIVDSYIYADEDADTLATISDTSSIRTIMTGIKEIFFSTYGLDDEESVFAYGLSFDTDGYMTVDSTELSEALNNNYEDVKELFVGYAEKEGIGTQLKTYLDDLDGYDGLITALEDNLTEQLENLEDDYEYQEERITEKYELLSAQFAEYTTIITQMENEFSALEAIIASESS